MSAARTEHAREFLRELADAFVGGGREVAAPFIEGLARDLDAVWTVPVERQDAFFTRMELQAKAMPELLRLHIVNTTRAVFVQSIIAALRLAVRVVL